jgi:hypothetical protein
MKTSKAQFTILPSGHGHYNVIYKSPSTAKAWAKQITDMELIDAVHRVDYPTQKALNDLKRAVKNYK